MQTATIYIQSAILSENGFDKTTPPEVAKLLAACAGVTGYGLYTRVTAVSQSDYMPVYGYSQA